MSNVSVASRNLTPVSLGSFTLMTPDSILTQISGSKSLPLPNLESTNDTGSIQMCLNLDTLRQMVSSKLLPDSGPFYWVNLRTIMNKYLQWKHELPTITPYYAVKCNPDPCVIQLLAMLGCNFDCASRAEMQLLQRLGIDPSRIIFANPIKMSSHLDYAKEIGVPMMTFDNLEELDKIAHFYPESQLVLRIMTDDSQSRCAFSAKFGAPLEDCPGLILRSRELGLKLMGVSFHVGSGGAQPEMFRGALARAKQVFDMASQLGVTMTLLDIGGGFPGTNTGTPFKVLAAEIRLAVASDFPGVTVIAEPGRYFVTEAYTLVCQVIGRRVIPSQDGKKFLYYLNDGIYQSFNCIFFDHVVPKVEVLTSCDLDYPSTLFGPTCDGLDCIAKDVMLPELQIGAWVYCRNMGAYTVAAASSFNGFAPPEKIYYYA